MSMKRYDSYRDTGISWIGKTPSHWKRTRIKYLISHHSDGIWGDEEKGNDEDIACYRVADFDYDRMKLRHGNITMRNYSKEELTGREITEGDLLLEKSGGGENAPVGRVVMADNSEKATCSNFVHLLKINKSSYNKYLCYYFNALYSNKVNLLFFNQTTGIQNLQVLKYIGQNMFLPPIEEQKAIAEYLDKKCESIDGVIATQERRITLLNELKQIIITDAVTRGINPNVPLKDSDIDWIGQIPQHWEVKPIKTLGKFCKGITFTKADLVDDGIAVISYGQIHSKINDSVGLNDELIRYIPSEITVNQENAKVKSGDFIFADTSEDLEGCGNHIFIEDRNFDIYAGYHTIILHCKESQRSRYLSYLFKTDYWRGQLRSKVSGVKVYSITQQILSSTSIIVPPIEEQEAIAAYLDEKCRSIDSALAKAKREVELLREYKQSVITEAVTGKIKVIG